MNSINPNLNSPEQGRESNSLVMPTSEINTEATDTGAPTVETPAIPDKSLLENSPIDSNIKEAPINDNPVSIGQPVEVKAPDVQIEPQPIKVKPTEEIAAHTINKNPESNLDAMSHYAAEIGDLMDDTET